ncbi:putative mannosyltransferase YycA [Alicyclobacillus cellulosilyticus]|uniref:Mannosyltransferase YycA n=1 Tax=Alicyclobacillus cellulosilyticus TaxID=1003997 RepID=A0A917NMV1_9BACL|nr:putative mannosyltransferase YycA [Alicyclobacillus cellulosilyticus]
MQHVRWHHLVLAFLTALSAFLNLFALWQEGYGNEYYAAAVKSMTMSWHNFFFNSFDPGGFITIDKPPVGFWLQVLSVKVFGFHGWALLLPQALAGVACVLVVYRLVRRHFGVYGGLLAAAVMALTPIAVAVSRTNEIDTTLVLAMLLAAWCLWIAIERRSLGWLLASAAVEGVAFNIKMMEAYLALPAFYVTYFLVSDLRWRRKLVHLAAMTAVLLAVSFSWPVAVDLTPASARPWVGSTQTNNEMELIFGYNGLERLLGRSFGHAFHRQGAAATPAAAATGQGGFAGPAGGNFTGRGGNFPGPGMFAGRGNAPGLNGQMPGANGNRPGFAGFPGFAGRGGFGGGFDNGAPGPLRLFQRALGGQIAWLLALALLSSIPALRHVRWRKPLSAEEKGTVFWLAWLLPMAAFFSVAGFFHPYYMITMAPGIAGLTAAGLLQMWRDWQARTRWKWWLPALFALNLLVEYHIVWPYPSLRVALVLPSGVAALVAAVMLWKVHEWPLQTRAGSVLGLAALLIPPGYWSLTPILYGVNPTIPSAGPPARLAANTSFPAAGRAANWPGNFPVAPGTGGGFGGRFRGRFGGGNHGGFGEFGGGFGGFGGFGGEARVSAALIRYLVQHYSHQPGSFLVATTNAMTAAPIILDTGLPVMAMGGFTGSDPAMTVQKLAQMTAAGKVKYFLIPGAGGFGFGGREGQASVLAWIQAHCAVVPESAWAGAGAAATGSGAGAGTVDLGGRGLTLYVYTGK